jgi:serine/threonine protein kinase
MSGRPSLTGERAEPVVVGRYLLCDVIGGGGMAKVHVGKVIGAGGFSRVVAIKRLHPESAADPQVAAMLVDEARLVSRIRHPNVVPTLDVVAAGDELLLVMEYVHGVSLSQLVRIVKSRKEPVPLALAARIVIDVLAGLGAAHEAKSERGNPLELVHRDVSPQNILVDLTGMARVVDFGIAKAEGKLSMTRQGQIKGKLNYMSPEQLRGDEGVDRRTDLYATGVVLWEILCGRRLFDRQRKDLRHVVRIPDDFRIDPPSEHRGAEAVFLDRVLARALAMNPKERFPDAEAMAGAIAEAVTPATNKDLAAYVRDVAGTQLTDRDLLVERAEQMSAIHEVPAESAPDAPALPAEVARVERARRPSRRAPLLVALGIAAVGLALGIFLFARKPPPPAFTPMEEVAAVPDAEPVVAVVASEVASTPAPPPPAPRPPPRAKPRPHAPDCNPPYSIDAHGVRIPRRECL